MKNWIIIIFAVFLISCNREKVLELRTVALKDVSISGNCDRTGMITQLSNYWEYYYPSIENMNSRGVVSIEIENNEPQVQFYIESQNFSCNYLTEDYISFYSDNPIVYDKGRNILLTDKIKDQDKRRARDYVYDIKENKFIVISSYLKYIKDKFFISSEGIQSNGTFIYEIIHLNNDRNSHSIQDNLDKIIDILIDDNLILYYSREQDSHNIVARDLKTFDILWAKEIELKSEDLLSTVFTNDSIIIFHLKSDQLVAYDLNANYKWRKNIANYEGSFNLNRNIYNNELFLWDQENRFVKIDLHNGKEKVQNIKKLPKIYWKDIYIYKDNAYFIVYEEGQKLCKLNLETFKFELYNISEFQITEFVKNSHFLFFLGNEKKDHRKKVLKWIDINNLSKN